MFAFSPTQVNEKSWSIHSFYNKLRKPVSKTLWCHVYMYIWCHWYISNCDIHIKMVNSLWLAGFTVGWEYGRYIRLNNNSKFLRAECKLSKAIKGMHHDKTQKTFKASELIWRWTFQAICQTFWQVWGYRSHVYSKCLARSSKINCSGSFTRHWLHCHFYLFNSRKCWWLYN